MTTGEKEILTNYVLTIFATSKLQLVSAGMKGLVFHSFDDDLVPPILTYLERYPWTIVVFGKNANWDEINDPSVF